MKTVEELLEFVEEQTSLLTKNWFEKKNLEFRSHPGFNFSINKIRLIDVQKSQNTFSQDYDSMYDISSDEELFETTIELDLALYCAAYLPINETTYWGAFAFDESNSNNYKEIGWSITSAVTKFIRKNKIAGSELVYKLKSSVVNKISESVKKQKDDFENEEYAAVLIDYLNYSCRSINHQCRTELSLYDFENAFTDKLQFNLQQEELVALVYILNKAGFLNTTGVHDYIFLEFCSRIFQFKKKNEYKFPDAKVFREKYAEIIRGTDGNGIKKISQKLKDVLKN